ncbi:unnamed protein product [Cuscuta campestris]|uniref:Cystatin domain-containing protein n=1 Tax=Cuscuta campestris TaxID=132261 RepID=A0A484N6D0_9ASTE|nr:unnamed protein product [Cuscuta campestris]
MIKVPFDLEEIYSADFCTELFCKFGCIFSLKYAIFKENQKQKKKLVLDKIIKSNYESGDLYYTTFLAKDLDTGETKIYQTKVWFHLLNAETEVLIFRERADQALQPGEDTQGVDMEIFPNLPAPGDALRSANLDINARGEDSYYRCLCYLSIKFALRTMDERENKDRLLWEVTEGFYGADLSFHTTFIVRDMDMDDEDKTYKIEVHFNTMSGELELRRFEAIVKNA